MITVRETALSLSLFVLYFGISSCLQDVNLALWLFFALLQNLASARIHPTVSQFKHLKL